MLHHYVKTNSAAHLLCNLACFWSLYLGNNVTRNTAHLVPCGVKVWNIWSLTATTPSWHETQIQVSLNIRLLLRKKYLIYVGIFSKCLLFIMLFKYSEFIHLVSCLLNDAGSSSHQRCTDFPKNCEPPQNYAFCNFHTKDLQILGATLRNSVITVTLHLRFVHSQLRLYTVKW